MKKWSIVTLASLLGVWVFWEMIASQQLSYQSSAQLVLSKNVAAAPAVIASWDEVWSQLGAQSAQIVTYQRQGQYLVGPQLTQFFSGLAAASRVFNTEVGINGTVAIEWNNYQAAMLSANQCLTKGDFQGANNWAYTAQAALGRMNAGVTKMQAGLAGFSVPFSQMAAAIAESN